MPISTEIPLESTFFRDRDATNKQQLRKDEFHPLVNFHKTTIYDDPDRSPHSAPTSIKSLQKTFDPPVPVTWLPTRADSIPLQLWEGSVLQIDKAAGVMHVMLDAKLGQVPRHTADIDLEWVSDQDEDLLLPGAVFYLTLYKRTRHGSIENSQELRFRRRPSWSPKQLKRIDEDASRLTKKMRALPLAE